MRVIVTALKAPWPEGTKIGDSVELTPAGGGDQLPAWALGKCTLMANDVAQEAERSAEVEKAAAGAKPKR